MSDINFKNWLDGVHLLKHPIWNLCNSDVNALTTYAEPGQVILLVGPTRVGKSTLLNDFSTSLNSRAEDGSLPVLSAMAANEGGHGAFTMKTFTLRLLTAIGHPFYNPEAEAITGETSLIRRASEADLRRGLEKAMRYRKVKYLIVDEAQHIRRSQESTRGQVKIIDSLKVLAETTGVVLILSGTYELLDVVQLSSHFASRAYPVHFHRYQESKEGMAAFASIVNFYDDLVTDRSDIEFLNHVDMLYDDTLGCIGALDRWMRHMCALAVARDQKIDFELLKHSRQPLKDIELRRSEIVEGEARISRDYQRPKRKAVGKSKKTTNKKPFAQTPKRFAIDGRGE